MKKGREKKKKGDSGGGLFLSYATEVCNGYKTNVNIKKKFN